jgi:hypothetical protein
MGLKASLQTTGISDSNSHPISICSGLFTWFIITHGSHIFEKEKSNYHLLYDIQFFEVFEITEIDGSLILKGFFKSPN